jgi:beta-glucosidase
METKPFVVSVLALCALAAARFARSDASWLAGKDDRVEALLARMTLDEKIGQMTQGDIGSIKEPSDVERYFLGSVLSGGGSDPKTGNRLEDWTNLYDQFQSHALKTRLKIPLLYGVDAVHGHSNVLGATVFPHNIGLGCTRNPALVEKAAEVTALEVRATGIQWTFAPMVAVVRDERWGRTYEGFGESPELSRDLGVAAVVGFQGAGPRDPKRVLACAKHYVGDGGTTFGTGMPKAEGSREHWPMDRGDTRGSEADLRRLYLPAYVAAVDAGVGTIMVSYNSWNGVKASASRRLLTEILKDELGFKGFLVSDWNAIDEIPGDYKSDVLASVDAGMDMFMVPDKYVEFFNTLKALVNDGRVPMSRIDDAVRRILRVKAAMGLLDEGANVMADRGLHPSFGSAEHRKVARDAVRQSLVLLKNERKALPLSKTAALIHVAGRSADDIGNQCGGWTIEWQGKSGAVTTGGTTILQAIRAAVSPATKVTFSADGSGAAGADVVVAVIGETPYAEMQGDRTDLALDPGDVATVRALEKAGVPLVVVLVTGRPMILEPVLAHADAIVAAWLPGTEGQGVADVLFGDYRPTGKLSYSWPRSMQQVPVNVGDARYDPLFPFGYGLTY